MLQVKEHDKDTKKKSTATQASEVKNQDQKPETEVDTNAQNSKSKKKKKKKKKPAAPFALYLLTVSCISCLKKVEEVVELICNKDEAEEVKNRKVVQTFDKAENPDVGQINRGIQKHYIYYEELCKTMKQRDILTLTLINDCIPISILQLLINKNASIGYPVDYLDKKNCTPLKKALSKDFNSQFYVQKLDKIMFHQRLGSFFDKVKRITSLAKFIAVWVPNASITKVEGVAQICKADLATSVVKEFPEMAGFVGYHYLKIAGEEDQDILSGVMSHNMPVNAHDQ